MGERKGSTSTLVDLLLGGWMGAGLALILIIIINSISPHLDINPNLIALFSVNFFPHLFGGLVATLLLARRIRGDYIKNSLMLGLSTSIIYFIMTVRVNLYILIGFFLGSYLGGIISKRKYAEVERP